MVNVYKALEVLWPNKKWWQKGTQFGYWGLSSDFFHRILVLGEILEWRIVPLWSPAPLHDCGWYRAWVLPASELFTLMLTLWAGQTKHNFLCLIWVDPLSTVFVLPNENVPKNCQGSGGRRSARQLKELWLFNTWAKASVLSKHCEGRNW